MANPTTVRLTKTDWKYIRLIRKSNTHLINPSAAIRFALEQTAKSIASPCPEQAANQAQPQQAESV